MLEVKILKVKHQTQDEARKLLPYIQNTDVYSAESPLTEELAVLNEADWEKMFSYNWSRSKFERVSIDIIRKTDLDQDRCEYGLTERSYLFRAKIPLLFLERHSTTDLEKIKDINKRVESLIIEGIDLLAKGKVNEFLQRQWESIQLEAIGIELRDRNMAHNIELAEERIRQRYPQFKDRNPIRYTAGVGSRHAPERYTSFPLSVHVLRGQPIDPTERLAFALEQPRSFDELKLLMLLYGAQQLIRNKEFSLAVEDTEKITYDHLFKELCKLK